MPKTPQTKRSPTKNEILNQRISSIEEKLENINNKTENLGKNMQKFVDKEQEKKQALLPLQKWFGLVIAGILFFLGIAVIVYSALRVSDNNIQDHLYIYGSILILLALIVGTCIHYYTKFMGKNYSIGGKILSSLEVEPPGLKTLLKK